MAEIGHSTLKRKRPLFLVDAAWEDVCSMIIQEEEFTKFLEGRGKSMERGPSTASQAARDKRAQCKRAKEYVQSFKENNFTTGDGEDVFISAKKAKHKAPNTFCFVPVTHFKLPFHQTAQVQLMLHSLHVFQVRVMLPLHQAV